MNSMEVSLHSYCFAVVLGVGGWAACGARALCVMRVCACAVRDACMRCVSVQVQLSCLSILEHVA